jgi:hypothetical protein
MTIRPGELVIDDSNFAEHVEANQANGQAFGRGYVPRDYGRNPVGSYAGVVPFNMSLIPRNEWASRIRDLVQSKSTYADLRSTGNNGQSIKSLDQNGQGYCWAYSPAAAIVCCRLRDGQPYVRPSAHAVACKIKNFRDQGGWNPLAVEYAIKNGYPSILTWPEKSMNRNHDNAATWAEAANYKITDGWMDLTPPVYDRNLSFDQFFTCLLCRIPCPADYNWWGHSVCAVDPVEVDASLPLSDIRRWGVRIWNSWTDSWGQIGMGVLVGNRAVPNGATACKGVFQTAA